MGAFSIELRRRGGKTINDIFGVPNKPAIGERFECQVDNKTVKATVVAIRQPKREISLSLTPDLVALVRPTVIGNGR